MNHLSIFSSFPPPCFSLSLSPVPSADRIAWLVETVHANGGCVCVSDCVLVGPQTHKTVSFVSLWSLRWIMHPVPLSLCGRRLWVNVCGTEPETAVFSDNDGYRFALLGVVLTHGPTNAQTRAHTCTLKLGYGDWYLRSLALYPPIPHQLSSIRAQSSKHRKGRKYSIDKSVPR